MRSTVTQRVFAGALVMLCFLSGAAAAQDERPASPPGTASTQIGDAWIDVTYSRPILRGRQGIFGSGEEYGKKLYAGGPLWRAGANTTTRIKTGLDLEIGGKRVPAGEYSFFIELKEGAWTAILSNQPYMETFDRAKVDQGQTWGAYGYKPEHDVVRAPMTVETRASSLDQMAINFVDVTAEGGTLVVVWDNQAGSLPFKVAK
ncbi:MAG TPA: DUF2911 domain-containing protein [Thermoanaerobaculia bacterium]|nr:DUF2911 domain-containing protein [Thermoanaerobaculia bacterium]